MLSFECVTFQEIISYLTTIVMIVIIRLPNDIKPNLRHKKTQANELFENVYFINGVITLSKTTIRRKALAIMTPSTILLIPGENLIKLRLSVIYKFS
jgi:hypothetical protein